VGSGLATRIGNISDTHGRVPVAVVGIFLGVERIVHAGDVGEGSVLDLLRSIAPVTAVRGNCDHGGEAALLPDTVNSKIAGIRFLVGHRQGSLLRTVDTRTAGVRVVVSGHSHKAHAEEVDGVLYVNPGTAGDDRGRGLSVAIVEIAADGRVTAEVVTL
jgi:putative phosphoesterase